MPGFFFFDLWGPPLVWLKHEREHTPFSMLPSPINSDEKLQSEIKLKASLGTAGVSQTSTCCAFFNLSILIHLFSQANRALVTYDPLTDVQIAEIKSQIHKYLQGAIDEIEVNSFLSRKGLGYCFHPVLSQGRINENVFWRAAFNPKSLFSYNFFFFFGSLWWFYSGKTLPCKPTTKLEETFPLSWNFLNWFVHYFYKQVMSKICPVNIILKLLQGVLPRHVRSLRDRLVRTVLQPGSSSRQQNDCQKNQLKSPMHKYFCGGKQEGDPMMVGLNDLEGFFPT